LLGGNVCLVHEKIFQQADELVGQTYARFEFDNLQPRGDLCVNKSAQGSITFFWKEDGGSLQKWELLLTRM
jgi:hypothetical protein